MPAGSHWEEVPLFYFNLLLPHRHWSVAILDMRVEYAPPPADPADSDSEDSEEELDSEGEDHAEEESN